MASENESFGRICHREPLPESFNPFKNKNKLKIVARGINTIQFGDEIIDISDVEQLVDVSQTTAIGHGIHYATRYTGAGLSIRKLAERVISDVQKYGLDVLTPYITGENAGFRSLDLAAAINRMRSLKIRQI